MSGTYITNLMMPFCGAMGLSIMASLAVLLGSVLSYHNKKYEDEKRISKESSEEKVDVDLSELPTPTLDRVISALKEIDTTNVFRVYLLYTVGTEPITNLMQFLTWKLGYSLDGTNGTSPGYVLAILIYSVYLISKHWIARNVIALALTCDAIKYLHLPNLSTAYLLLWSFLCLDYFWVFVVNAMSTAAAVELPYKVVFPGGFGKNNELLFSILGCGDIFLPGMFMALLYRIDHRHSTSSGSYFKCSFISYALGLIACSVTAHLYHTLLPALIFLVPGCTLPPLILAAIRGELHIFRYDEIPTNSTNDSHNSNPAAVTETGHNEVSKNK